MSSIRVLSTYYMGVWKEFHLIWDGVPAKRYPPNRQLKSKLFSRQDGLCSYCNQVLTNDPCDYDCDHIIPVSLGGLTREDNLHLLCVRCHRSKSAVERRSKTVPRSDEDVYKYVRPVDIASLCGKKDGIVLIGSIYYGRNFIPRRGPTGPRVPLSERIVRKITTPDDIVRSLYNQDIDSEFIRYFNMNKKAIYNRTFMMCHQFEDYRVNPLITDFKVDRVCISMIENTLTELGFGDVGSTYPRVDLKSIPPDTMITIENCMSHFNIGRRKSNAVSTVNRFSASVRQIMGYIFRRHERQIKNKKSHVYTLGDRLDPRFLCGKILIRN